MPQHTPIITVTYYHLRGALEVTAEHFEPAAVKALHAAGVLGGHAMVVPITADGFALLNARVTQVLREAGITSLRRMFSARLRYVPNRGEFGELEDG